MPKQKRERSVREQLAELERIVAWFEEREDLDLEEGLAKAKDAAAIARTLRERLKEAENEFEEIKAQLDEPR